MKGSKLPGTISKAYIHGDGFKAPVTMCSRLVKTALINVVRILLAALQTAVGQDDDDKNDSDIT